MNDFEFGNRLYNLRKQAKLSQSELAEMVGLTNKAVSKWESGKSKPAMDTIKKLSVIFKLPIEELLKKTENPYYKSDRGCTKV